MTVHYSAVMPILIFLQNTVQTAILLRQKWTWSESTDMAEICTTEEVPGQRASNQTIHAAISRNAVITHMPIITPTTCNAPWDFWKHLTEISDLRMREAGLRMAWQIMWLFGPTLAFTTQLSPAHGLLTTHGVSLYPLLIADKLLPGWGGSPPVHWLVLPR